MFTIQTYLLRLLISFKWRSDRLLEKYLCVVNFLEYLVKEHVHPHSNIYHQMRGIEGVQNRLVVDFSVEKKSTSETHTTENTRLFVLNCHKHIKICLIQTNIDFLKNLRKSSHWWIDRCGAAREPWHLAATTTGWHIVFSYPTEASFLERKVM